MTKMLYEKDARGKRRRFDDAKSRRLRSLADRSGAWPLGTKKNMERCALLPPVLLLLAAICPLTVATNAQAQYTVNNLVSSSNLYSPKNLDPNLIDGWGLAALPGSPWWLSAQNSSSSPLYDANGKIVPLLGVFCLSPQKPSFQGSVQKPSKMERRKSPILQKFSQAHAP